MKRITFKMPLYGTMDVPDDCPETKREAEMYLVENGLWHQVPWEVPWGDSGCWRRRYDLIIIKEVDEKGTVSQTYYKE